MGKLSSQRRERMAQAMFRGKTEVAAFKAAGYKGNPRTCASKAANKPDKDGRTVKDRVAELNRGIERKNILDKTEALEMLSTGARAAFEIIRLASSIGTNGLITLKTKVLQDRPDLLHAIKEVVNHADGLHQTVRIHGFHDLIATIAKLEGWEAPKNLNIRRRPLEEWSDEELDELESRSRD